jgi:hypothetical protein
MTNDVVRWTKKLCEAATPSSPATTTTVCDKACEKKSKCENNLKLYQYDDGDELYRGRRIFLCNSNFLTKSICNRLVFLYIILNMFNLIVSVYCDDLLSAPGARGHFTPTWAVHIPGGDDSANNVATEHGFINLGKVSKILNITNIFQILLLFQILQILQIQSMLRLFPHKINKFKMRMEKFLNNS